MTIGDDSTVQKTTVIGSNVQIGDNVVIAKGVVIGDGAIIGDNVTLDRKSGSKSYFLCFLLVRKI